MQMQLNDDLEPTALALTPDEARRRWGMVALLVGLNVVDIILTRMVLDRGGLEFNPLMRDVMASGWLRPFLVKGLALVAVGAFLAARPQPSRLIDAGLVLTVGFYLGVVGWNIAVLIVY